MISRWHVDHDQSINTIPISERQLALHITKNHFNDIKKRLEERNRKEDAYALAKARNESMKKEHQNMVEAWENSIQNSLLRKTQRRKENATKQKLEKIERYFEIKKEQEEKRTEFLEDVRRRIYRSKGYPYEINRAMLFSEILHELNQQKRFNTHLQLEENQAKLEEARNFEKYIEQEKCKSLEKLKELQSKKQQCKNFYLNQILEAEENKNQEREQKEMEILEKYKIMDHLYRIEKLRKEKETKIKQNLKNKVVQETKRRNAWEKERKVEETEADLIIAIQKTARDRITDMEKKKEQELRDAIINKRIAVSEIVAQIEKKKYENEEALLQRALNEREEIKKQQIAQKVEKIQKLKTQRLEYQKEAEEREKQRKLEESEVHLWEMQKKRLTDEYTKKYNKRKMEERRNQILEYRRELQEQIEEKLKLNEMQRAEAVADLKKLLEEMECEDKKLLEYAEEVLHLTESRGRPVYPIKKVIQKYRKENMRQQY